MKLAPCVASVSVLLLLLACGATSRNGRDDAVEPPPGGGGARDGAGGGSGAGAGEATICELAEPRFVRLTFPQLVSGLREALGNEVADGASRELEIDGRRASFLSLQDASEGSLISGAVFEKTDELAQQAGRYVAAHFELTGCARDDFGCVSDYVAGLAEKLFRRPVEGEELEALLLTVERAQALGVSATVAAEYGVYAAFSSPRALYRTELGDGAAAFEVPLDGYELASQLAYVLTDRAPDSALLEAAESGQLSTDESLRAQVARLLQAPDVRGSLQQSLARQLGTHRLDELVVDRARYPEHSPELALAMKREIDELLAATLWSQPVQALLTSRAATLNQALASLYDVPFPPAGTGVDASGFATLELPEARAGLLTRAGILLRGVGPEGFHVVRRGRNVAMDLLCEPLPPPPADTELPPQGSDVTARESAEYRMATAPCSSCHAQIDPIGLALEDLDSLGRLRGADEQGRPIDAHATLPQYASGATVNGAVELSQALSAERVASCLAQRYLERALAPSALADVPCEREALARRLAEGGEVTFSRVLEEVALSRAFRLRRR